MCFLKLDIVVFLLHLFVFTNKCRAIEVDLPINQNVFQFRHMMHCKDNEFYNLDYFTCLPCDTSNVNIMQSVDKFTCQCVPNSITLALYDTSKRGPVCIRSCTNIIEQFPIGSIDNDTKVINSQNCRDYLQNFNSGCIFKYINFTSPQLSNTQIENMKQVRITTYNPDLEQNCTFCDLKWNFHYQGFCISDILLKPFLNYNAFRQQYANTEEFRDLKFVAFFCLTLHNSTACNQLANMCIMTHYSFDKNSPCSAFLLSQTTESLIRFAQLDEQLKQVRPFLFYKKGKQTRKMLSAPVKSRAYSLESKIKGPMQNSLHFFATVYGIDGSLQRWGKFRSSHVNLCYLPTGSVTAKMDGSTEFRYGLQNDEKTCQMRLENIIDLATIYGNKYFMSIYLNFTNEKNTQQTLLQSIPILIEDLLPENRLSDVEEWQLVRRFQLFETYRRHNNFDLRTATYEDVHKLLLFKRIRYVEKFEIQYNILEDNRISIPLIKLRYRTIDLNGNSSLDNIFKNTFHTTFYSRSKNNLPDLLDEIVFVVLLLFALLAAMLRTYNFKNRRPQQAASMEACDFAWLTHFLLVSISFVANAFLLFFLIHIMCRSLIFLTQRSVTVTLPITKNDGSLHLLVYAALILKCLYLSIYFWRLGRIELFFIDWERPRTCDSNHFNLKSNLETSSVCSSVRTFISDNNVSAWRMFFIANEWIKLSGKQRTSIFLQGVFTFIFFNLSAGNSIIKRDITLQLFMFICCYITIYVLQLVSHNFIVNRIFGNPLQKFVDTCSLANISVFTLLESSYGFYIHGRSPHGFSDTDVSTMLLQLQRESQNMCGRRGLLSDSDQQTYVVLPPINLRIYCENLLIPFQRNGNLSQAHFKKEATSNEGNVEKTSIAYNSVNRFFCAFIDHAIRDMDYIIKEKTFLEKLLCSEFDNYLTNNKGTFYIDNDFAFSQLFLYGNSVEILIMELLLLLMLFMLTSNLTATIVVVCLINKILQYTFRNWVRENVARKTLIDKRFLK